MVEAEDRPSGEEPSSRGAPRQEFSVVFAKFGPRVRAFAERRLGDEWADDIVQETFLRAYRAYDGYVEDGKAWPWLRTIANNLCIGVQRRARLEAIAVQDAARLHGRAARDETFRSVDAEETGRAIEATLVRLNPRQRRVLILREMEEQSYQDIADADRTTVEGVKATLKRARSAFRAAYGDLPCATPLAGVLAALRVVRRQMRRITDTASPAEGAAAALAAVVTVSISISVLLGETRSPDRVELGGGGRPATPVVAITLDEDSRSRPGAVATPTAAPVVTDSSAAADGSAPTMPAVAEHAHIEDVGVLTTEATGPESAEPSVEDPGQRQDGKLPIVGPLPTDNFTPNPPDDPEQPAQFLCRENPVVVSYDDSSSDDACYVAASHLDTTPSESEELVVPSPDDDVTVTVQPARLFTR